MKRSSNFLRQLLRAAPFLVCAVLAVAALCARQDVTAEKILSYTPREPLLAAAVLLLLYALKTLSVVFPILALQLAAGHLFAPWAALTVNVLGMLIELTLSYWAGRCAGQNAVKRLVARYPGLGRFAELQRENSAFVCFFLRVVNLFALDVVGMYLGAAGIRFSVYLPFSALGLLPGVVCATLLGASIRDPSSPMFLISLGLTVGLSLLSLLFYALCRRKH